MKKPRRRVPSGGLLVVFMGLTGCIGSIGEPGPAGEEESSQPGGAGPTTSGGASTPSSGDSSGNGGAATVEYCSDGFCNSTEDCTTCPTDCGECPPACGDSECNGDETCSSCPADCGACPPTCGDSQCNGSETCSSCPADCGACPPVCGDNQCNGGETCNSCPADCGLCGCGDGTCAGAEDCQNCPDDCGGVPIPTNFNGVVWLHTDVSSWAQTANLQSVTLSSSLICLNYDKANVWPGVNHVGAFVNGNPWIFIHHNHTWYAATWEWLRHNQTCKNRSSVAGDHIKQNPFWNFQPRSGACYGFMVSGLARDSVRNVYERSQVKKIQWP